MEVALLGGGGDKCLTWAKGLLGELGVGGDYDTGTFSNVMMVPFKRNSFIRYSFMR